MSGLPKILLFVLLIPFFGIKGLSQDQQKEPRHYLANTFYLNYYASNRYDLTEKELDSLGNYSFDQTNFAFYIPLLTRDKFRKDSGIIANHHLLLTGNYLFANPHFSNLPTRHTLVRNSIGIRYMYNNGKKGIWFFDFNPFVTYDNRDKANKVFRNSSIAVYNHRFSETFSMTIGFTKTFLFGDRLRLPILGMRVGRLDGVYGSLIFPRNLSIHVPLGRKFTVVGFVRPMGGVYNFANNDTMPDGSKFIYNGRDSVVIFGRYEFLNGLRLEFNPSSHFSWFISGGVTKNNVIGFASYQANQSRTKRFLPFAVEQFSKPAGFFHAGLTWRFGKTKKVAGNLNMYELIYLNNTFDPGDNNDGPGSGNQPKKSSKKGLKKLSYKDLEDFIEPQDLY